MSRSDPPKTNRADEAIIRQINRIRRQVKRVELITTLAALATFLLAFLLCSVVMDHWIFKEGTPSVLRGIMILGFLVLGIVFFIWKLMPILRFPVNPAYAAEVLERCHPDMKNRLLNWVFLKREKRSLAGNPMERHILDGMSRETAVNLNQIQMELVVDHRQAFRWGIGCIILLALFFLYAVISPKNPLDSIIRTINPLSTLDAPQSLVIKDVSPGNLTVFQGTFTQITTRLDRPTKLPVHVVYSTLDGKRVDQRVPMSSKGDGYHFETRFPPGKTGFQESLTYRIEAGESRSQSWDITVRPAIYVQPEKLEYRYPEYTALAPETVENGGEIIALEGTQVTLQARSNIEMDRAEIVFDAKSDRAVSMTIPTSDRTRATVGFMLGFDPDDLEKQLASSYMLKCRDKESNPNPSPITYAVKVIRDLPPSVVWIDENNLPAEVPLNAKLEFQIEAEDPDFGLRHVRLLASKVETSMENADLVATPFPPVELLENPTSGKITLPGSLLPSRLKLKPGDRVDYYIEATDVKLPQPNQTNSSIKSFIVVDPVENPDQNPNSDENEQNQDQQGEQKNQEGNNEGEHGSDQQNKGQDDQQGDQPNEAQDDQQGDQQNKAQDDQQGNQQNGEEQDQQGSDSGQKESDSQSESQPSGSGEQNDPQGSEGNQQNSQNQGDSQPNSSGDSSDDQAETDGNESGKSDPSNANDQQPTDRKPRPEPQKRDKPVDGESNPGDVFRETLERMKEKGLDPEEKLNPGDPQGEKSDQGTPPKKRPQQGDDTQDRSDPDAFSAKEGENAHTKNFDPSQKEKPIYQDPNDPGQKSNTGNEKPEYSADELNMDQKPQGGTPQNNATQKNPSSQNGDQGQTDNQQGDDSAKAPGETPAHENPNSTPSDSNRSESKNPPQPGGGSRATSPPKPQEESGNTAMDPNLEYTEKATSLAIDYLEDELGKQEPDPELLDKLRWSKQDLEKFVARWKRMQENAARSHRDSQDSKQWEETLKNIGRLAPRTTTGTRDTASRVQSTATESHRYTPPSKLRDRAEAYTQGLGSQK